MNRCGGIGDRVEARIRGDGRRVVVVAGSKTRGIVFGSDGLGDLGDVRLRTQLDVARQQKDSYQGRVSLAF